MEETSRVYDQKVVLEKLVSHGRNALEKFEFLWQAFGIKEEQIAERANVVIGYIFNLFDELLDEEKVLYENLKKKVSEYENELKQVCLELDVPAIFPSGDVSLLKKESSLRHQLDELQSEKRSRLKEYEQLAKKESKLCDVLAMPKTALLKSTTVPKTRHLVELQENVRMLVEEKERRYKKFRSAKQELTTIMEVTEYPPETEFEREIVCYYSDDDFILSNENIENVTKSLLKFQQRKCELEREIKDLKEKLSALWDRLKVENGERLEFLDKFNQCKQSTLLALKTEVERCEELKRQNIGEYIAKLKEELVNLWDKCCLSDQDKEQFKDYFNDCNYSEDLLDVFDKEVDKLQKYYTSTNGIFQKIERRRQLWESMLSFEQKAADPNRFNNRGGNLLREERQRKKLIKDLPQLENEILQAIAKYEEEYDTVVSIYGVNFVDYVKKQWEEHEKEKENIKLERQKLRTLALTTEKTPSKRPLPMTPSSATLKYSRIQSALSASRMPTKCMRVITPKTTPLILRKQTARTSKWVSPRYTPNRQTPITKVRVEKNAVTINVQQSPNATSYSQFATELEKNATDRYRSSVLHSSRVYGGKVRHSGKMRKSSSRSSRKSSSYSLRSANKMSDRNMTLKTPTKMTPAKGKSGLPFLI